MTGLEKSRIIMWVFLAIFSMVWGVVAGASFFAGAIVSPSIALFGLLGNLALVATAVAIHREHPLTHVIFQKSPEDS